MASLRLRLVLFFGVTLAATLAAFAVGSGLAQEQRARGAQLAQAELIARLGARQLEREFRAEDLASPGPRLQSWINALVQSARLHSAELIGRDGRVILRSEGNRAQPRIVPSGAPRRVLEDDAPHSAIDERGAAAWAPLHLGGEAGWVRVELDETGAEASPLAPRAALLWASALLLGGCAAFFLLLAGPTRALEQAADHARGEDPAQPPLDLPVAWRELKQLELALNHSSRRSAERIAALEASERRLARLLGPISSRVFEVDCDLVATYLNPAWTQDSERPLGALIGTSLPRLLDAEREGVLREKLFALMRQRHDASIELAVAGPRGETRWFDLRLCPRFEGESLVGFSGSAEDVTAEKLVGSERAAAKRTVDEANRMKSTFLANMSHELRTPMNAIIGMTDLLLESELDAEQRKLLENARSAADNLLGIINDVLDFSKIETGRLDFEQIPFGIRDCVEHAVASHRTAAAAKGLLIEHRIDPTVPVTLEGDPHRLRQVLQNLVGNAVKFTESGHVVIRASAVSVSAGACVLRFSVEDTGIGIPLGDQERIFSAFSQADSSATRRYGGTGLGLSVASRLVERMGGRIAVISTPGEGSTFSFSARFTRPRVLTDFTAAVPADSLRIMIAGENAFENSHMEETLASWQMRAQAESNGALLLERLRHASSSDEPFHVIVLGDRLSDMDAFEFARRVRGDPAIQSPAIILAASGGQRGDAAQCRQIGINAYLTRPLQPLDLLDAILLAVVRRRDAPLITRHSLREQRRSLQILLAARADYPFVAPQLERLGHVVHRAENGLGAIQSCQAANFDVVLLDAMLEAPDALTVLAHLHANTEGRAETHVIALVPEGQHKLGESLDAAGADVVLCSPPATVSLVAALRRLGDASKPRQARPAKAVQQLRVFDADRAREYLDNDEELLAELIRVYLDGDQGLRARLRQALELGDLRAAHAAVHSIAGSVGSFMAESALAATAKVESRCRDGRAADIGEDLALLWQELDKLADALRETLLSAPALGHTSNPQSLG